MNRNFMPIDFRTFVVFTMLSLTFLPMCSPDRHARGGTNTIEYSEVSAPEDAHLPPADKRAAGAKRHA